MKKLLLLAIAAVALLAACRKETNVDVVKPTITRVTINNLETSEVEVSAGGVFMVRMDLSDNLELNEVRVAVHSAENAHTHSGTGHAGGEFHLNSGEWAKDDVLQTSGTTATLDVEINVPDTIAGQWHLVITAMDKVGNVSLEHAALITVSNDELPFIEGSTDPPADATGTVFLNAGGSLLLDGTISDTDSLQQVVSYVLSFGGQQSEIVPIEMTGTPATITFLDLPYSAFPMGTYRVVIDATDKQGHRRLWDHRVIVQ
ncbi:MAG: DUF4625 domain-containing protein [Flavobacteriales bacterium]